MEKGSKEWYMTGGYHNWISTMTYNDILIDQTFHRKRLERWLRDIDFETIAKDKDVLEVAFNNGKTIFWTLEKYGQIFNVSMFDFDPNVIEWAKQQNQKWDIDIFESDVQNIQKPNESFDIIFCLDVIEHLKEDVYLKMIKELYRVLRKGGIVIVFIGKGKSSGHINFKTDNEAILDFMETGFELFKKNELFIMKKI